MKNGGEETSGGFVFSRNVKLPNNKLRPYPYNRIYPFLTGLEIANLFNHFTCLVFPGLVSNLISTTTT